MKLFALIFILQVAFAGEPPSYRCPTESQMTYKNKEDCESTCPNLFRIFRQTSKASKESWSCTNKDPLTLPRLTGLQEQKTYSYYHCALSTKTCGYSSDKTYKPVAIPHQDPIRWQFAQDLDRVECKASDELTYSDQKSCLEGCEQWFRAYRSLSTSKHTDSWYCRSGPSQSVGEVVANAITKGFDNAVKPGYGHWRCEVHTPRCNNTRFSAKQTQPKQNTARVDDNPKLRMPSAKGSQDSLSQPSYNRDTR